MEKISVIITIYNDEKYIERCVTSAMQQTYQNIEILLINDGSTDNSKSICEKLLKQDQRIVYVEQSNSGVSAARNSGVEKATGEYLCFIDSDDFVHYEMLQHLYRGMIDNDCDISIGRVLDCYNSIPTTDVTQNTNLITNKVEAMKIVLEAQDYTICPVAKLYKRSLFNDIRYPVGITYEDAYVILPLLDCCNKVYFCKEFIYYYMHRTNSITTTTNDNMFSVIDAYEKNYQFIKEKYPELISVAQMRRYWANFNVLDKIMMDNSRSWKQEEKDIVTFLKSNKKQILEDQYFTKSRKIAYRFLLLGVPFYRVIIKFNNHRNIKLYK